MSRRIDERARYAQPGRPVRKAGLISNVREVGKMEFLAS
jgi:hypothetical protein